MYHHVEPQHKSTASPPPTHTPHFPYPPSTATNIGVPSAVLAHSAAASGDVMLLVGTSVHHYHYVTDLLTVYPINVRV